VHFDRRRTEAAGRARTVGDPRPRDRPWLCPSRSTSPVPRACDVMGLARDATDGVGTATETRARPGHVLLIACGRMVHVSGPRHCATDHHSSVDGTGGVGFRESSSRFDRWMDRWSGARGRPGPCTPTIELSSSRRGPLHPWPWSRRRRIGPAAWRSGRPPSPVGTRPPHQSTLAIPQLGVRTDVRIMQARAHKIHERG
jgi:hypothetical protein